MKRRLAESWALWLEGKIPDEDCEPLDASDRDIVERLKSDLDTDALLRAMSRSFNDVDEQRFVAAVLRKAAADPAVAASVGARRPGKRRRPSRRVRIAAAAFVAAVGLAAAAGWHSRRDRHGRRQADAPRPTAASSRLERPGDGAPASRPAPPLRNDVFEVRGSPARKALVVLGQTPPAAGDPIVINRLRALGFRTTVRRPWELDLEEAAQVALVAISSTVESRDFTAEARHALAMLPVPVVVWEPWLLEGLGMADCKNNNGCGWLVGSGQLNLIGHGKPLLETQAETLEVTSGPVVVSFGIPKPAASTVAEVESVEAYKVLFVYERGAQLTAGAAPARRVALFLSDETAKYLTLEGWGLFDSAINWAVAEPPTK